MDGPLPAVKAAWQLWQGEPKMKTSWIAALVVSACVLAAGAVLWAADVQVPAAAEAWRQRLPDTPLGRLIGAQIGRRMLLRSQLELTAEQRQRLAGILRQHLQEIVAVAKPLVQAKRALRQAVMADEPDAKKIRAAAEKLGKAIGDAAVLAGQIKAEAAEVLTPKQLELIKKFQADSDQAVDKFLDQLPAGEED